MVEKDGDFPHQKWKKGRLFRYGFGGKLGFRWGFLCDKGNKNKVEIMRISFIVFIVLIQRLWYNIKVCIPME